MFLEFRLDNFNNYKLVDGKFFIEASKLVHE
jgi:hypothetical protein